MGRKLPFLPTCGSPSKTLSFRATATTNTGDLDDMAAAGETVESVIRGLTSDRFFFNPGRTSSILEEAKAKPKDKNKDKDKDKEKEKEKQGSVSVLPFKESVSMMEMESTDPFVDFKKSMQEMVEADAGLKKWENLQELLSLYLAVNDKINHGYIIRAFIDLLMVNLGSPSSSSSSSINGQDQSLYMELPDGSNNNKKNKKKMMMTMSVSSESPESALSFTSSSASSSGTCSSTSHCLSSCSLEEEDEDEEEEDDDDDDEDHNSPQKTSVSDFASSSKV